MHVVRVKPGVEFAVIAPAGFRILSAIDLATLALGLDLTITSGSDGEHSGPNDPHHRGEAFDVRSHGMGPEQKEIVLQHIMATLGWDRFYGLLEDPDQDTEHFHFQIRKGTVYP